MLEVCPVLRGLCGARVDLMSVDLDAANTQPNPHTVCLCLLHITKWWCGTRMITLSGGSLGSWVDEERSQLR